MPPQSLVQALCLAFASHVPVQFRPEAFAMILDPGVNEFMEDDIVHQVRGQCDKIDVQADIIEMRATAPSTPLVPYIDPVTTEAMLPGQFLEPVLEHCLGPGLGYFGCIIERTFMLLFNFPDIVEILPGPSQILMQIRLGRIKRNAWRKCHSDRPKRSDGDGDPLGPFGLGKDNRTQMRYVESNCGHIRAHRIMEESHKDKFAQPACSHTTGESGGTPDMEAEVLSASRLVLHSISSPCSFRSAYTTWQSTKTGSCLCG